MSRPCIVLHERRGVWAGQLRPRLSSCAVRWLESRSRADLIAGVGASSCPIVVLNLGSRLRANLEDLFQAARAAPNGLFLVLDAEARPGVTTLARELGATHIWSGVAPPPAVADWLRGWIDLAQRRILVDPQHDAPSQEPEPQPWAFLLSN